MRAGGGPAPRPTIGDVARMVGVSGKTVSRVLNGEPGVSAATTARIHAAIAAVGFRRNDMARVLRKGMSTRTLGLVIEDVGNPFFSAIAKAVERVAREHGYLLIAGSSDEDPAIERELIRTFLERRVDGLLIVPTHADHRFLVPELSLGMPMVFMDRPPRHIEADSVLIDNVGGARRATEHLIGYGHRRIALIGDVPHIFTAPQRLLGYRLALEAHDIEVDPGLIRMGNHDGLASEAAARELLALPDPPTAMFATNNRITVGVMAAIDGTGTALIGFDDLELAERFKVPLSVISHNPTEMGLQATGLLFRRLQGDDGPVTRIVLPTELIARGSAEIAPPGHPGTVNV